MIWKLFLFQSVLTIIFIFQIALTSTTIETKQSFFLNAGDFVGELVTKSLKDCKLYFIYGNFQSHNHKSPLKSSWLDGFEKFVTHTSIHYHSGGVTTLQLYGNQTLDLFPISRPPKTVISSCSATILLLPSIITPDDEFILTERLTKPYINPATIRNTDKYLIISKNSNFKSICDSNIINSLKYKLILTSDEKGKVLAHRLCSYCPKGPIRTFEAYPAEIASDIDIYFPDLQENYYGSVLKTSASDKLPGLIEIAQEGEGGKYIAKRGVYASALFHLVEKLNFTYELIPSSGGGSTGHPLPNGTWVGTVGDAYSGRTDFGLMAGMTLIRFPVIELCATITFEYISFATGPPGKVYTWRAIFWPFSSSLWIGMLSSIFFAIVAAHLILKSCRSSNNSRNGDYSRNSTQWGILSIAQYYGRTFIEQGDELPHLPEPLRVLVGFWLLFVLVSATAYKSKMVSFMTFPVVENLPDTFDELEKSNYEITFHYFGNVAYNTFKTSTNPTYKNIFQRMGREPNPLECLKKTMNSKSACILFGITYDELRYRNLSDRFGHSPIELSPNYGFMYTPGVLHQKKAALSINFKRVINAAMEMGLIGQWQKSDLNQILKNKNAWERKNKIEPFGNHLIGGNNDVLHLPNLIGCFAIQIFGTFFGIVLFLGEHLHYYYRNRRF